MRTIYMIILFIALFAGVFVFSYGFRVGEMWIQLFLFLSGLLIIVCSGSGIVFLGWFCIEKYHIKKMAELKKLKG